MELRWWVGAGGSISAIFSPQWHASVKRTSIPVGQALEEEWIAAERASGGNVRERRSYIKYGRDRYRTPRVDGCVRYHKVEHFNRFSSLVFSYGNWDCSLYNDWRTPVRGYLWKGYLSARWTTNTVHWTPAQTVTSGKLESWNDDSRESRMTHRIWSGNRRIEWTTCDSRGKMTPCGLSRLSDTCLSMTTK